MTARSRTPIIHSPGVLAIPLTKGLFALIDEEDAPLVSGCVWHAAFRRNGQVYASGRRRLMHRIILGLPPGRFPETDHINRNGLDNRRTNIRAATKAQNMHNAKVRGDSRTGFKGVGWHPLAKCWRARAGEPGGRIRTLGYFPTPEAAARAYDAYVLTTRGEFARLNFPK